MSATSEKQKRCSTSVSADFLRGLPFLFESEMGGLTRVLTTALTKLACNFVPERTLAKVFVMHDLSNLRVRTKQCAALVGGYAATADTLEHGQGPLLLYDKAGRAVRLTPWLSPQCRNCHQKGLLHPADVCVQPGGSGDGLAMGTPNPKEAQYEGGDCRDAEQ